MAKKIFISPSNQTRNLYAYGNTTEAIQCGKIGVALKAALERCGFETKLMQYYSMSERVAAANNWGANLYIPVHSNAYNGKVAGTRMMAVNTTGYGYKACKAIFKYLAPITPGTSESISAAPRHDYSQDEEFDSDLVDFQAKKNHNSVNHLICLGKGELQDRTVIHLYADGQGNISQTQTFTGLDEYAAVYDYPNAESVDDLKADGTDKLKELWEPDELSIDFTGDSDSYDIGDVVGAYDNVTRLSVCAEITKKIVKVKNGQITISYEVGE